MALLVFTFGIAVGYAIRHWDFLRRHQSPNLIDDVLKEKRAIEAEREKEALRAAILGPIAPAAASPPPATPSK